MKTIIAGSRDEVTLDQVRRAFKTCPWVVTEVVSGGARGADKFGEMVAAQYNIPVKQFIPDWDGMGKSAGYKRNTQMVEYAEALILIWNGVSRGSKHCLDLARKKGLKIHLIILGDKIV